MQGAGLAGELGRVIEPSRLLVQRAVLLGSEPRVRDLVALEAEEVGARLQLAPPCLGLIEPPEHPDALGLRLRHLAREFARTGERIQNAALLLALEQRLMLVLAVQVHQHGAQLAEECRRCGRAVHPGPVAPFCGNLPFQDDDPVLWLHAQLVEPGDQIGAAQHVERSLDHRPLRARAHDLRGGALAEQQRQGADQNRLPRPGLA